MRVAFWRGISDAGYVEGGNIAIEYRWAENQYARLPALAADLVRRQVTVLVAGGASNVPVAAKRRPEQFRLSSYLKKPAATGCACSKPSVIGQSREQPCPLIGDSYGDTHKQERYT